jgi:hypothetical protein
VSSGIPGVFFAYFSRRGEKPLEMGAVGCFRDSFFLAKLRFGGSVVAVFLFEVVEPFFSVRLHPNTSLRESNCQKSAAVHARQAA